jgi:hypothetical protein
VLATLLTHYFCAGMIIALGLYAMIRLRGQARVQVLAAFAASAVLFVVVWGPFMWEQRQLFSTEDSATLFLKNDEPTRIAHTLLQAALLPARLLAEPRLRMVVPSAAMALIYVLPFVPPFRRRRELLIWSMWLLGTAVMLTSMDLSRKTNQLEFIRYGLLAGPTLYVLVPALLSKLPKAKWAIHLVAAAAALQCAMAARDVYHPVATDPRLMASEMGSRMSSSDLIIFAATGHGAQYLMLNRYQRPIPCPIVAADSQITGPVLERARASRYVFLCSAGPDPGSILPGFKYVDGRFYLKGGIIYQFAPR